MSDYWLGVLTLPAVALAWWVCRLFVMLAARLYLRMVRR